MNVLVMYDRQTDSLWSQLLGEAVEGPLKGTRLEYVASLQTTWAEWKELHPDTLALQKDFRSSSDSYTSYYNNSSPGVIGESRQDQRLDTKELVVGVALEGAAKAYPFSYLSQELVVNDQVGGRPVVVVFDPASETGAVFSREIDGKVLDLKLETAGGLGDALLVDKQTGATWVAFTGVGLEGSLAGSRLQRIPSTSSFWFGWKDFYTETEVYNPE